MAALLPHFAIASGDSPEEIHPRVWHFRTPRFFFTWGYNRAAYTRSTIHFDGNGYHFQLDHLKAKDRPSTLRSGVYTHLTQFTIPQYNYAIGYHLNPRLAVMVRMDHMKYVMVKDQVSKMKGTVDPSVSTRYAGEWHGEQVQVSPHLLTFEHTDGLNYLSGAVRYSPIPEWLEDGEKINIRPFVGLTAGVVIPKTKVEVMGYGLDNRFHLAGGGMAVEAGTRLIFFRRLFLAGDVRAGYLFLPSVLIHNEAPDRAHHHFGFLEGTVSLGYQFLGR